MFQIPIDYLKDKHLMANVKITYDLYDVKNKNSTLKITCDNQNDASTLIKQLNTNGLTCIQPSGTQNNSFFIARVLTGQIEQGYYKSHQGEPHINCPHDTATKIAELLGLEKETESSIKTYEKYKAIHIKRTIPDETKTKRNAGELTHYNSTSKYLLTTGKTEQLYSQLSKELQSTITSSGNKRLQEILNALNITITRINFEPEKGYCVELSEDNANQLFDRLNSERPSQQKLTSNPKNPLSTATNIDHTDTETPTAPTQKTQAQDANQDQSQNNDAISAHQTLLNNCNRIKIQLIENLNKEYTRLNTSSFLTGIGVISTGTDKINALNALKGIITNPDSNLKALLIEWKAENHKAITKQRNRIHTFFSPAHQTSTLKKVKELFKQLDLDYDALDSLNTPSPKPSN